MGNRTAEQCRSHFQKMILKYNCVDDFIEKMMEIYGKIAFDEIMSECPLA